MKTLYTVGCLSKHIGIAKNSVSYHIRRQDIEPVAKIDSLKWKLYDDKALETLKEIVQK